MATAFEVLWDVNKIQQAFDDGLNFTGGNTVTAVRKGNVVIFVSYQGPA